MNQKVVYAMLGSAIVILAGTLLFQAGAPDGSEAEPATASVGDGDDATTGTPTSVDPAPPEDPGTGPAMGDDDGSGDDDDPGDDGDQLNQDDEESEPEGPLTTMVYLGSQDDSCESLLTGLVESTSAVGACDVTRNTPEVIILRFDTDLDSKPFTEGEGTMTGHVWIDIEYAPATPQWFELRPELKCVAEDGGSDYVQIGYPDQEYFFDELDTNAEGFAKAPFSWDLDFMEDQDDDRDCTMGLKIRSNASATRMSLQFLESDPGHIQLTQG